MAKLSFDWNARENCSEAFIGGFRIRAEQDSDARNPWDDMDGLAPLLVYSDRNLSEHGDFPNPLDSMSDSFIGKHWLALTKAFARPASGAAMHKRAYGGTIADARRELLSDWYHSDKPDKSGYGAAAWLDLLESLFGLLKWPAYRTQSRGYCQGDWADLLLVYSPAFAEAIGATFPRSAKAQAAALASLKAESELWGAWAWGDVYGAVIDAWDGEAATETHIESCRGFYGSDFAASGLAEYAESTVAAIAADRKRKRTARLKEVIRARVPLALRADIMKGFPL